MTPTNFSADLITWLRNAELSLEQGSEICRTDGNSRDAAEAFESVLGIGVVPGVGGLCGVHDDIRAVNGVGVQVENKMPGREACGERRGSAGDTAVHGQEAVSYYNPCSRP